MSAATRNLPPVYVGDNFSHTVTLTTDGTTAINITSRTYVAQLFTATGAVAASLTTAVTGASGIVTLTLANATTTTLGAGSWRWSLVETASAVVTTLLVGTFTILSETP